MAETQTEFQKERMNRSLRRKSAKFTSVNPPVRGSRKATMTTVATGTIRNSSRNAAIAPATSHCASGIEGWRAAASGVGMAVMLPTNSGRHCEEQGDEAIQGQTPQLWIAASA